MKVLVLGLFCIVWLQSSCSAPKWTGHEYGDYFVDDSDTHTDNDFSDYELDLMAMELKGNRFRNDCRTGPPQERTKDPDYETVHRFLAEMMKEPPSGFWTVVTALRGVYVLWMFLFFCSWFMKTAERLDTDCCTIPDDRVSDMGRPPVDEDTKEAPFVTVVVSTPAFDDVPKTVLEMDLMMVGIVDVVEKLAEDVTISVDMEGGDGFSTEKFLTFNSSIEPTQCPRTVADNCNPELVDEIELEPVDGENTAGLSTNPEDPYYNSSTDTTEREFQMSRPDDSSLPGTSWIPEMQTVMDVEPLPEQPGTKKPNIFRRANKAFKKWKKSIGKKTPKEPASAEPPPPEQRTLEEINRMWNNEKVPYLRPIPKVHFRQRVEVKTFLVGRPMSRYADEPKKAPSEMTRIQRLKREGEFREVGPMPTKKSFKHRLLRGLDRAFSEG